MTRIVAQFSCGAALATPTPQAAEPVPVEAVSDAHEIALRSIAWQRPRLEPASTMTGSPERWRCFHCGHAWQPDCKPHHDPECAYVIAVNALAAQIEAEAPTMADALEADARRYRWLRKYHVDSYLATGELEQLDDAIDRAALSDAKGEDA